MIALLLRAVVIFVVCVISYFLLHWALKDSNGSLKATALFTVTLIISLFPSWVFWELEKLRLTKEGKELPILPSSNIIPPISWNTAIQFLIIVAATALPLLICQAFVDSFSQLLRDTDIIIETEMKQVILITFSGYIAILFLIPTTIYVCLSIGRRSGITPPRWIVLFFAATVGIGIPIVINLYYSISAGEPPAPLSILDFPGEQTSSLKGRVHATAYLIQSLLFIASILIYTVYLKVWCWCGNFIQRRGWA